MSLASRLKSRGPQKRVFVVHGRNILVRDAMFEFLGALKLEPIEWTEAIKATRKTAPFVGDILDQAFQMAGAIVVILTPDDEARLRPEFHQLDDPPHEKNLTPQARPNVIFEAGMGLGRHPNRTILVEIGQVRPFSDVGGRHTVRFQGTAGDRHDLKERLKTAGCPVDDGGKRWLTVGDFDKALKSILPHQAESTPGAEAEFEVPRYAGKIKWIKLRGSGAWDPCCPNCTTKDHPIVMSVSSAMGLRGGVGVRLGDILMHCTKKDCSFNYRLSQGQFDRWTEGRFDAS